MKRKILFFGLVLIISLGITSCSQKTLSPNEIYYPEKTDKNASMMVEWNVEYNNLKDLYNSSDFVVYADVIGDSRNIDKGLGFVGTKIKINEVLKGNISEKEIEVIENGWVNDDGTDYSIEGIPLLKKNMKAVLFLFKNYDLKEESNNKTFAYQVNGPLPGKFLFDNNMKIHHCRELLKDSSNIPATDFEKFSNQTYEEFKQEIKNIENQ